MSKSSLENPVAFSMGWGATVLGLFGGIALFLPGPFKDFMLAHPLWGWAGLVVLLIAYRPILRWNLRISEARQSKIWGRKVTKLSSHWSAEEARLAARYAEKEAQLTRQWNDRESESAARWNAEEAELAAHWQAKKAELSRADRERDLPLLKERLLEWELNGDFHKFLTQDVLHYLLPSDFVSKLEHRLDQLQRDPRDFADPDIARAWDSCKAAAGAYVDKINEYMWENDKADFLQVPPEWKDKDHMLYRKAFQELEECRSAFSKSLTEVYRIQHSKVTSASLGR